MGVTAVIVCVLLPSFILKIPPQIALVIATSMSGAFSILLVFADSRERYWSYTFPSMILITLGSTAAYMVSKLVVDFYLHAVELKFQNLDIVLGS